MLKSSPVETYGLASKMLLNHLILRFKNMLNPKTPDTQVEFIVPGVDQINHLYQKG